MSPDTSQADEIDRLYAAPLDSFTSARDELVRSLRTAGERAAADEVKRLRKPNLVAWALNQVSRTTPDRIEALLDAGDRLEDAQRRLVGGGDRDLLRAAAATERRLVEEVAALGERHLMDAGHNAAATVQAKLRATVHAAAVGAENARDELRAGRLLHDYEVSDFGLAAAPSGAAPAARKAPGQSTREAAAERTREAAAERQRAATLERKRAGERARLEQALARAQAEVERARSQLDAATARVAELDAAIESLDATAK